MTAPQTTAREYFNGGANIVPVKQKKPLTDWARWQTQRQTTEEFENLPWTNADGFAVICGTKLNNNLFTAAVDFDIKNVTDQAQATGKQVLKRLPTTQMETTPSGGQHWIYHSHTKPKTMSCYHKECGLELLGEGKLCIMAPTKGYKRLNDNTPTVILDMETQLYDAMFQAGFKPKPPTTIAETSWFDRKDLHGKRFTGQPPPCIDALYKGAQEGERNENAIRLASYLANFQKVRPDNVLELMRKFNKFNDPPLTDNELQGIVKSAINGGYVYGCQDPILKNHCNREECQLAPANAIKTLTPEETQRAKKLVDEGKLLDNALEYGRRRLIGEDNALLSNFVILCSGRTRYPISGVISGYSGSGKNESVRAVKPLIPREWCFEFTTSTPEAMKYLPEEFDGTLLIYEALGVKGDSGSLSLRAIGEGESIETIYPIRNERTGEMRMGRAKTNARNFITTSSDVDINPDLYRRVLKHTMNHSTLLTKRVMAKKLRDASYPESLRKALGLQKELPFKEEDFQNALRLLNWKPEVIVFPPPELLRILDLAVKREQEVALRTHIEKIINFTKTIALLNQNRRLQARIERNEYVVAETSDFLKAMEILQSTITETISRIEKRQEEALKLFTTEDVTLNNNDVASKLKIANKTATKLLKTLAQTGYLKEEKQGRTNMYQLLQSEPNELDILKNIQSYSQYHQNSLRTWLKTIETIAHTTHIKVTLKNHNLTDSKHATLESNRSTQPKKQKDPLPVSPPPPSSAIPNVQSTSELNPRLISTNAPEQLDYNKRSSSNESNLMDNPKSQTSQTDQKNSNRTLFYRRLSPHRRQQCNGIFQGAPCCLQAEYEIITPDTPCYCPTHFKETQLHCRENDYQLIKQQPTLEMPQ